MDQLLVSADPQRKPRLGSNQEEHRKSPAHLSTGELL
jgi:hypothetical protein